MKSSAPMTRSMHDALAMIESSLISKLYDSTLCLGDALNKSCYNSTLI
jgi:hypothetical protein